MKKPLQGKILYRCLQLRGLAIRPWDFDMVFKLKAFAQF